MHRSVVASACYKWDQMSPPQVFPYHLVSQQQDGLQAELAGAEVEEVLQTGPQQLHHHHVVVPLRSTPLYRWYPHCSHTHKDAHRLRKIYIQF